MANPSPMIMLTLVLTTMSMVHTRPLTNTTTIDPLSLAARLRLDKGDGGSTGCWDTLFELQACTGEIILFFINGETYLGTGCCRAIVKIEKMCWPSLMGSIGFTSEEGDILRGYCDVSDDGDVPPTAQPPPRTANTTAKSSSELW
ncbi:hypothetical protein L1987_68530 [Smallanthus sonchifolius]|uniref:Uncharacterized protein n=1 Tax=Smallanthus sonchifolius TaxID=185202 RepID=A0ACB9B3Z5_9ASTR|nr:hypothetical protein L1987_68530 [Smallanthus sonchifolius]